METQSKFPDQLSQMIGELNSYRVNQNEFNTRILAGLERLESKIAGIGELSATLAAYRGTLHERFNNIHLTVTEIDEDIEKLQARVNENDVLRKDVLEKFNNRIAAMELEIGSVKMSIKFVYGLASITGPLIVYFLSHFMTVIK